MRQRLWVPALFATMLLAQAEEASPPAEVAPPPAANPATDPIQELEDLSKNSQLEGGELPPDVKELDQQFKEALGKDAIQEEQAPTATGSQDTILTGPPSEYDEPGSELAPPEQFARVPIKPRMSDQNWRRFAGKQLSKDYKVKGRDTLWAISERLFGNPHLWPKVWQLNANFSNPHVIEKNTELKFDPGNPNSAPRLAFKTFPGKGGGELPAFDRKARQLSFLEMLDERLRNSLRASHPPFQAFLLDRRPDYVREIPKSADEERLFYTEGDEFPAKGVDDGEYTILRIEKVKNEFFGAYQVRWVGLANVRRGRVQVTRAFVEVQPGDVLSTRRFELSPLALYETQLNPAERSRTRFVPLQEGVNRIGAPYNLVGIKFAGPDVGPRVGAVMQIRNGREKALGTVVVIDRDRKMGTGWLVSSEREVDLESNLE